MPVFLSHKREDLAQTMDVARYLKAKSITCYVDAIDTGLQVADDITSLLMTRIESCSHLMAVVSNYTTQSWWVPFEAGVASQLQRRISSYQLGAVALPEFLTKWPVLRGTRDLDRFVEAYRRDTSIQLNETRSSAADLRSADQFHKALKSMLGQ